MNNCGRVEVTEKKIQVESIGSWQKNKKNLAQSENCEIKTENFPIENR